MKMASLEMVSTQMFECVPGGRNKRGKDLKVLVRDQFDIFHVFPVDDSGSNKVGKSQDVLECSSRSSVSETEESLQTLSSNSSPLETNSNLFYSPGQPENPSRNEIIIGASFLVQIWEARSQHSSSSHSQSLIDSRTSSGLGFYDNSNSSSFSDTFYNETKHNNGEIDWCSQSDRSYVLDSCEKERDAKCFPPLVRIRGRQAFDDFSMMIMRDREKELKWLANLNAVSKFSPRGFERLQYMLRIRRFERCIAIQERHRLKLETMKKSNSRETQDTTNKPKMAKKAVFSEDEDSKHGLKNPEIESKATDKGQGSENAMEKAIVMESVETNKTSLSIAEKVNLWDSKETTIRRKTMEDTENEYKAARRFIMEAVEINKEEVSSSLEEGKSVEFEECRINRQETTSVIGLDKRKEEETESPLSRESSKAENFSQDDEEKSKAKELEESEAFCLILESPRFINGWDENEMEDEEDEDYSGEIEYYDWVSDISRPRSYWEDLRKQRELELIEYSKKDDIRKMIKRRTVSSFLASDFREDIDKILISQAGKRLQEEVNPEEKDSEEWRVDCSARYQEKLEENETEKIDLETVTVSNGFSQYSTKNTMTTWSFEDHEAAVTSLSISSNRKDHENISSTEMKMICELREEIKQLQREILELRSLVKSCVGFQESVKSESLSGSVSDSLKRNCSCRLAYVYVWTMCLKCGHELQWSSKKCPICMAPIVVVVRAFLDS